ncbi:MAG: hypothetical protein M0019_05590 [Actinomycetota bacterium]|nr:hypothetical protein [Actinomycetota bacterium]
MGLFHGATTTADMVFDSPSKLVISRLSVGLRQMVGGVDNVWY